MTQLAQSHEVTRQQIYARRHDLKKKGLWSPDAGALFIPLDMPMTVGVLVAQAPVCVCSFLSSTARASPHLPSPTDCVPHIVTLGATGLWACHDPRQRHGPQCAGLGTGSNHHRPVPAEPPPPR